MKHLVILSFLFLGLAFYQLSGGASFDPDQERTLRQEARAQAEAAQEAERELARAARVKPVTQVALAPSTPAPAPILPTTVAQTPVHAPLPTSEVSTNVAVTPPEPTPDTTTEVAFDPAEITSDPQDLIPTELITALREEFAASPKDMRQVRSARVNLRQGPGTRYDIVGKLTQGQEVEVLQAPGAGWVKLQVVETQRIGWMSERLLTAQDPEVTLASQ